MSRWTLLLTLIFYLFISTADECYDGRERPNIVFILMDGLGWGDLSANTGKFPTPNMDSLWTHSVQLTRHYVHLAGSPSRTQFLTGRYAMNLGMGSFQSLSDSMLGGIPVGQPTIAQWLSEYGAYTCYGVGKWHLGYANKLQLPMYKGFDHYYGFYQDAIDFNTKTYHYHGTVNSKARNPNKAVSDIDAYDFFEDSEPCLDALDVDENSQKLFSLKIEEYLEMEADKVDALKEGETANPFYLYVGLQGMHSEIPDSPDFDAFSEECDTYTATEGSDDEEFRKQRKRYCALLMYTDDILGDIMYNLKSNQFYANTLIVFTTVHGGDISAGASNYPFRGSVGELHDGNNRVIAALSGGILQKDGLIPGTRDELFSNLDWTPTLLDFAGYLDCIDEEEYTWDGMSQYPMVMATDDFYREDGRRKSLVLNIEDKQFKSSSIVFDYKSKLYKFIHIDPENENGNDLNSDTTGTDDDENESSTKLASWSSISSTLSRQSVGIQTFDETQMDGNCDLGYRKLNVHALDKVVEAIEADLEAYGFDENGAYVFDGIAFGSAQNEDVEPLPVDPVDSVDGDLDLDSDQSDDIESVDSIDTVDSVDTIDTVDAVDIVDSVEDTESEDVEDVVNDGNEETAGNPQRTINTGSTANSGAAEVPKGLGNSAAAQQPEEPDDIDSFHGFDSIESEDSPVDWNDSFGSDDIFDDDDSNDFGAEDWDDDEPDFDGFDDVDNLAEDDYVEPDFPEFESVDNSDLNLDDDPFDDPEPVITVSAPELRGCVTLKYSQAAIDEEYQVPMYLFNLSGDEGELYNLMDPSLPYYDRNLNGYVKKNAMNVMQKFVDSDPLFSPPIQYLHQKLADGDPKLTGDGRFLEPFFDDSWYLVSIENMLEEDINDHSVEFQDLYLDPWTAPKENSDSWECLDELKESANATGDTDETESVDSSPNIVFILLDGLGYGDLSATTGKFPTPNMDSLYEHAVRLTRHYVHLAGSPSRTQFLTGRYAMNMGFGEFDSWEDSVIGGIPIGQPTVAQWLHDFGGYTTYGVGKWNLGYANRMLTPEFKGFDHFYGFYQDAIDYENKVYQYTWSDEEPIDVLDWFEDGQPVDITQEDENTLELQYKKIEEYLISEGNKLNHKITRTPFYLYASLQAMDTPLPDDDDSMDEFEEICAELVEYDDGSDDYKCQRKHYCEMLLTTDKVIGDIVQTLKDHQLYEDTLIVFTAANGGDTHRGASNYPLRGSQGQLHDGNNRVLTSLSGGVMAKEGLLGDERSELFSNLDWTPTLLDFAGLLDCIDPDDYTWDGISQRDLILNNEEYQNDGHKRKLLILNVGDKHLSSGSILIDYEGTLFKFIIEDNQRKSDEDQKRRDTWSTIKTMTDSIDAVNVIHYDEDNKELQYSQSVDDMFLFEITSDESEKYNLLDPELPYFDQNLNEQLLETADYLLKEFIDEDPEFSPVIDTLFEQLPEGNPSMVADGSFMRPFLNNAQYKSAIKKMFIDETYFHSKEQKALYEEQWISPNAPDEVEEEEENDENQDEFLGDSNYDEDDLDNGLVSGSGGDIGYGDDDMDSDGFTEGLVRGKDEQEVLAWWIILLIVVAGVVLLAAVVICIVKCCQDKRENHHSDMMKTAAYSYGGSDEYKYLSIGQDDDAPMSYQTFT